MRPASFILDLNKKNRSQIPVQKSRSIINKKKRNCQQVNFSISADHSVKVKGREKHDKKVSFHRTAKMIPVIVGVLGTIPKTLK